MLKVIYLGGMYHAEYSMMKSFINRGSEIKFLIDTNPFSHIYWSDKHHGVHSERDNVIIVPESQLKEYVKTYKPDLIIHRYYMDDPCMHPNSYRIAQECGVPLIRYIIETDYQDNRSFKNTDYDALLYCHDTPYFNANVGRIGKPAFFYPYGVSGTEIFTLAEMNRELFIPDPGHF
jgi:hypothetical protein